jgi:Protein of unknown function (DUF1214)
MGGRDLSDHACGPRRQAVERDAQVRTPPGEGRAAPLAERGVVDLGLSQNFYAHNPIERYGIPSGMPLVHNDDGSLDVYIQARSPGRAEEPNWLPCPPSGLFNLTVRVYHPDPKMISGRTERNLIVEADEYALPPVIDVTRSDASTGWTTSPRRTRSTAAPRKADLRWQAGHAGIAHRLRDEERRHRDAGHEVERELFPTGSRGSIPAIGTWRAAKIW